MPKVCHFLRKSSQLRASFINNQISNHIKYEPYLVHRMDVRKADDGGYADFAKQLKTLDLGSSSNAYENLLYAGPKVLSGRQVNQISGFLESNQIDIVHFHYGTDCGVFYPLTPKLGVPSVVSFYGYDISSFPKYLMGYGRRYLQNRVFKHITKVLAMSPDMRDDLIKAGCPAGKIIVHYYGTDCDKFYMSRQYPQKNHLTIMTLSNLCAKKGHVFQFKVLKMLIEQGITNFTFRVVGSGELTDELKSFVNNHGLSDYVTFTGPVKYGSAEMMKEFTGADIFLHPSVVAPDGDKEGIPGTIIEAMASGLPVVSTFHAGIPFVISNENTGLLVKEWDVEALSDAIVKLINNRNMREELGTAAQQYAMSHLNLKEKEKELESIYDSVVDEFKKA